MKFNVASQRFNVVAFNESGRVSGDAANITCSLAIDGGTRTALGDTNPVEIGTTGEYVFDLTQAETNGHALSFTPSSATSGVQVLGVPSNVVYTTLESAIKAKTDLITVAGVTVVNVSASTDRYDVTSFVGETHSITILTTADHSGKALEAIWEPMSTSDTAVILNASITITTESLTFNRPYLGTSPGKYYYAVRDTGNGDEVILYGTWDYKRTAAKD